MKYRFLKLSIFSFTTYFLAVPVNADLVELNPNSNNVSEDRIEQLTRTLQQAESYLDSINIPPAISEPKSEITPNTIYSLRDHDSPVLLKNNRSRYNHLKVEKKTYYPDSSIHAHYNFEPQTFYYIYCRKKEFDNTKICYLKADDIYVFLINGRYSVDVGSNHYPRSKAGLRIDNNPAVYGYEGEFSKPLSIIEKLKKGKFAYTRYQEWPYLSDIDKKTDLKDFTKQFNEMLKQYKEL